MKYKFILFLPGYLKAQLNHTKKSKGADEAALSLPSGKCLSDELPSGFKGFLGFLGFSGFSGFLGFFRVSGFCGF